jgi:hypothetical protein
MDITMPLYIMLWACALAGVAFSVMLVSAVGFWIYLECKGIKSLEYLNKESVKREAELKKLMDDLGIKYPVV